MKRPQPPPVERAEQEPPIALREKIAILERDLRLLMLDGDIVAQHAAALARHIDAIRARMNGDAIRGPLVRDILKRRRGK